jgi:hypothetical protein
MMPAMSCRVMIVMLSNNQGSELFPCPIPRPLMHTCACVMRSEHLLRLAEMKMTPWLRQSLK